MKEVFVSRPNDVNEIYDESIKELDNFLYRNELKPITMGVNLYSNKSPIVSIREKMEDCSGLIILGLPKTFIEKAEYAKKVSDHETVMKTITNKKLPTSWNQIEGTMAYMLDLPIMIITEEGIDDGLLDKATLGLYQHNYDLSNPKWISLDSFKGAFDEWKKSLK